MQSTDNLYPGILIGHLTDEELQILIDGERSDQSGLPRGELRILFPMPMGGEIVQVYTIVEGQLLWFKLVPPDRRIDAINRQQRETKVYWQLGNLLSLQKIERKTIRWYPEGFADAAFQIGEHVRLYTGKTYEGIIRSYWLYHDPANSIGITTYDIELQLAPLPNEMARYILEYDIERITEKLC